MLDIIIEDEKYGIPEDFTIKKFVEVVKWDLEEQFYWTRIISDALDIPYDKADMIPVEKKQVILVFIMGLLYPKVYEVKKEYKGGKLKDFTKLNLGEFIDLDIMLTNGLTSIYGIIEKLYGIKAKDDMMISEVYPAVLYYLNFRKQIFKEYENLFGLNDNDGYMEEEGETIPIEYKWYELIVALADGKFLDITEVVKRPVKEAFNFLSYMKDKAEKEKKYLDDLQRNNRIGKGYM